MSVRQKHDKTYVFSEMPPGRAVAYLVVPTVLNIALGSLFIFCFGWEILGVALASLAGQVLSVALLAGYLVRVRGEGTICPVPHAAVFRGGTPSEVLQIGFVSFCMTALAQVSNMVVNILVSPYGTAYLAASTVACMMLTLLFSNQIVAFFIDDPTTIACGRSYLTAVAWRMVPSSLVFAATSFMQAIGQKRRPYILAFTRMGTIDVLFMCACDALLGAPGVLFGKPLADWLCVVTACIVLAGLRRQGNMFSAPEEDQAPPLRGPSLSSRCCQSPSDRLAPAKSTGHSRLPSARNTATAKVPATSERTTRRATRSRCISPRRRRCRWGRAGAGSSADRSVARKLAAGWCRGGKTPFQARAGAVPHTWDICVPRPGSRLRI